MAAAESEPPTAARCTRSARRSLRAVPRSCVVASALLPPLLVPRATRPTATLSERLRPLDNRASGSVVKSTPERAWLPTAGCDRRHAFARGGAPDTAPGSYGSFPLPSRARGDGEGIHTARDTFSKPALRRALDSLRVSDGPCLESLWPSPCTRDTRSPWSCCAAG